MSELLGWMVNHGHLTPAMVVEDLAARLLHTGIKGNRLYVCDQYPGTQGLVAYFLIMDDASTPRQFVKFVPPEIGEQGDADLATANGYRDAAGNSLSLEQYLLMESEG